MKLAAYLREQGLTLEQFAQKIGRTAASVSRLQNGKQRPDWDTMEAIRRETGGLVTPNDFIEDDRPFRSGDAAAVGADAPPDRGSDEPLRATGT